MKEVCLQEKLIEILDDYGIEFCSLGEAVLCFVNEFDVTKNELESVLMKTVLECNQDIEDRLG